MQVGGPWKVFGGGWRLCYGRSGSQAGLAGSCREDFWMIGCGEDEGWRLPGPVSAPSDAQCQASHKCCELPDHGFIPRGDEGRNFPGKALPNPAVGLQ